MKKILTVLGARPQFIKASVVSAAILKLGALHEIVVHTGQHYDKNMSDVFFSELEMSPPNYHLGIAGGNHGEMTGRMLIELEPVLLKEKPDAVLVYGDTNSTLAGALIAAKLHIPIAHVEAGLRSFNMRMPEEVNRILTDRVSRWLFTPTQVAGEHLRREGTPEEQIMYVGDVMYDAVLHYGEKVDRSSQLLAQLALVDSNYILVTIHRAENTDDLQRLHAIAEALKQVACDKHVVWPLHPRTRTILSNFGLLDSLAQLSNIHLIPPVSYLDMVQLEKYAEVIVTDSGGLQKEAFFHRIPCVTLRDETEWTELVDAGWNRLVSPNVATEIAVEVMDAVGRTGEVIEPYGKGDASMRLVKQLVNDLC